MQQLEENFFYHRRTFFIGGGFFDRRRIFPSPTVKGKKSSSNGKKSYCNPKNVLEISGELELWSSGLWTLEKYYTDNTDITD